MKQIRRAVLASRTACVLELDALHGPGSSYLPGRLVAEGMGKDRANWTTKRAWKANGKPGAVPWIGTADLRPSSANPRRV